MTRATRVTRDSGGVLGRMRMRFEDAGGCADEPGTVREIALRSPTESEILDMTATEFRKANLVLLIRSALLGEDIQLASGEEAAARAEPSLPVYLMDEIGWLYATGELHVEELHLLHRLKKVFHAARLTWASAPVERRDGGGRP